MFGYYLTTRRRGGVICGYISVREGASISKLHFATPSTRTKMPEMITMSEYLGWNNRRPTSGTRGSSTFDRDILPGGPVTHSYESYVKNIFHPANRLKTKRLSGLDKGIAASTMLRMERTLGKDAIDDRLDITGDNWQFVKTPLESLYQELGLKGPSETSNYYRQFPVYEPKQSSEYYSIAYGGADKRDSAYREPIGSGGFHSSYIQDKKEDDYEKNNRTTLIDYKAFDSAPLSPYLYRDHPYVRNQDSRIVGSNFVQVTSRPKDRFLEKVEKTLADVRAMPRF